MFNSEDEDAMGLLSQNLNVDEKIDLSQASLIEALEVIESELAKAQITGISKIWFYFALADGAGQTLFAPIGNLLRQKLKAGKIIRAMPAQTGGWIVRIHAKSN